jgi:serralysin
MQNAATLLQTQFPNTRVSRHGKDKRSALFDLGHFTSTGTRGISTGTTAAYFSLNNGVTDLGDYDTTSDGGDWTNSAPLINNPFCFTNNASTQQTLTASDIQLMNTLGFQ